MLNHAIIRITACHQLKTHTHLLKESNIAIAISTNSKILEL